MYTRLVAVALLFASSVAHAEHPRNLVPIESGPRYVLAQDFLSTEKAATFTLKAGSYVAAFENRNALFLLGEANCLELHVVPPKQPEHAYTMPFNCGIYYPKQEGGQALFFYIRGESRPTEFGLIVNAIIKAGEGSFNYPIAKKNVVGLRQQLQLAQP
jgi:hypothetical protein